MPKQHTLFGRPIPRFTARRLSTFLVCLSLLAIALITTLTSAVPSSPRLSAYDTKFSVPRIGDSLSTSILNPFRQPSHRPPRQKNDEYAGSSWWADWKWLTVPFSSSVTLDDDRALLPPLRPRQPIYCYYDATAKKMRDEKDAESELLLTWRRAWWARGFRPVVLSSAEAVKNPSYDRLQRIDMEPEVRADLMRWLAWETMGGGVLAHYTLLPTVSEEDSLLVYLRRGEYPRLTRWKDLGDALFTGHKDDISAAIQQVTDPSKLTLAKGAMPSAPDGVFDVDAAPTPLASYSQAVVDKKYAKVADSFKQGRAQGLGSLNKMINAHLHVAWQNRFPDGIEVLKPRPKHTTTMVSGALRLARRLASCSESPMPSTCPPNLPKCTPCVARSPVRVSTPARYHNSSRVFTIGTVPHPWTLALADNLLESLNISWIRRESARDPWLTAVTQDILGTGVSGNRRVMSLKEAVAGERATTRSLWLVAEKEMPTDLSWHLGFSIPEQGIGNGKSESPVPAHRLPNAKGNDKAPDRSNGPVASEEDVAKELPLLERARQVVAQTKPTDETRLRASLEAWSMADTEAWKFVRAFESRRAMERAEWDKEEAKYSSGAGTEQGRSAWNRWQDRRED